MYVSLYNLIYTYSFCVIVVYFVIARLLTLLHNQVKTRGENQEAADVCEVLTCTSTCTSPCLLHL